MFTKIDAIEKAKVLARQRAGLGYAYAITHNGNEWFVEQNKPMLRTAATKVLEIDVEGFVYHG